MRILFQTSIARVVITLAIKEGDIVDYHIIPSRSQMDYFSLMNRKFYKF